MNPIDVLGQIPKPLFDFGAQDGAVTAVPVLVSPPFTSLPAAPFYITTLTQVGVSAQADELCRIEDESFPESIRETHDGLLKMMSTESAITLLLWSEQGEISGSLCADVLEAFDEVPGVRSDPHHGLRDTLYITTVAVLEAFRGHGQGVALERRCLEIAARREYGRVTAHIHEGHAAAIGQHNVLGRFDNWYETGKIYEYVEFNLDRS